MAFTYPQPKDPDATIFIEIDWSNWLGTGEAIASSVWNVPSDLVWVDVSTATSGVLSLAGGQAGRTYSIMQRITTTTSPPQMTDRTVNVVVADR